MDNFTFNVLILGIMAVAFIVSFFIVNNLLKVIKTLINEKDYNKSDLIKLFLSLGIMFLLLIAFLSLFVTA